MRWPPFVLLLALVLVPVMASGQEAAGAESIFFDYLNPERNQGFLHIPGLDFHSSMGFSFLSSGDYGSTGMGFYMGHFNMQLSSSLTLRWDVGLRSTFIGPEGAGRQPDFFIPNVDLTYRPNDKFFLRFQYRQGYGAYYPAWRR